MAFRPVTTSLFRHVEASIVDRDITLVRHGVSAHAPAAGHMTSGEFREWIALYNRTGLAPDSLPPPDLIEFARSAACLVCSDLPRAAESAARLAPGGYVRVSPLFREAGRPLHANSDRRATFAVWDRLSVYLWRTGKSVSDESIEAAQHRASLAADELVSLTTDFGRTICVGHGTFNQLIGNRLLQRGWMGPQVVAQAHWSAATFLPPQ